ncbi:MAG TPA: sulfatase-like hydrolase/transferase [Thermoleophilaceae bacterium]|nr:sulfatase-like hydrolase/transferase [Thermoleophilaceae bacterium]
MERHPPVVFVVFDEFPADDLLRPDGSIDAERFPNFAKLASISTWFPNAHTVYDSTFKAVPAILDGRFPRERTAPDVRSHKPSVFHVMDRLGYRVFKVESASAVCPPDICPGARTRRPGVLARLAGGGRPARFHRWVGEIRQRERPTFYFHHALMPHEPWLYLPSGRQSRPAGEEPVFGVNKLPGFDDPDLSVHNHLRHLLQVGFTDHLVGQLLARLRRTGLLKRALVVVTADHGYSFRVGARSRRLLSEDNVEEIAPVPLFVKAPGQMEGRVSKSLARNLDLVATIADLLGTRVFYRQDGRSLFSDEVRHRRLVAVRTRDFTRVVRIGVPELQRRRAHWRRRWDRLFGTGAQSALLYGDPWDEAYRIGPHPELLDRRVASLPVGAPGRVTARVANAELLDHVTPRGRYFPARVTGPLHGVPAETRLDLALAVNGRIRAVGRSFDLWFKDREFFSMLIPESALRRGRNRIELFEVRPGGTLVRLYGAR